MYENVFPLLGQVGLVTVALTFLAVLTSMAVAEGLRYVAAHAPRPRVTRARRTLARTAPMLRLRLRRGV